MKKLILVVDDDEGNLELFEHILKEIGHNGRYVGSAEKAIEIVKKTTFDLIIMDYHLPQKNGLEAAINIKEEQKINTPIVIITSDKTLEGCNIPSDIVCGIYDKPVEYDSLKNVVSLCIEKYIRK